MKKLSKRGIATSVCFSFWPFYRYTKLSHSTHWIVINSFVDFCINGGENKYITINSYGARGVKDIKNNAICLNKQQIKDTVMFIFF